MKMIGYARVSTRDQNVAAQREALLAAGCETIFDDTISGSTKSRSGLDKAMAALVPGDVLVVWKLDRLGRSMQHVVNTVLDLDRRGIGFRSLTEAIDLTEAPHRQAALVGVRVAGRSRAGFDNGTHKGGAGCRQAARCEARSQAKAHGKRCSSRAAHDRKRRANRRGHGSDFEGRTQYPWTCAQAIIARILLIIQ